MPLSPLESVDHDGMPSLRAGNAGGGVAEAYDTVALQPYSSFVYHCANTELVSV